MRALKLKPTDLAFALLKASEAIHAVMRKGVSLDRALLRVLDGVEHASARGATADLAYYGLRWRGRGQALVSQLSGKPRLKPELLEDFLALCFSLIWQVDGAKYPAHTVVDQAVNACAASKDLQRAKGLVNACLRNFLRDQTKWVQASGKKQQAVWNFPNWWVAKVQRQLPAHWQDLLKQANTHPPMVLRVNSRCQTGETYLRTLQNLGLQAQLLGPQTVLLAEPVPVAQLPGFEVGEVSIQDSAAQLAAPLLEPAAGQRILDACAAPGGKTGHLLELAECDVLALDRDPARLERVQQNYDRIRPTLGDAHNLTLKAAHAEAVDQWWDGQLFDSILADLPCSGSGVVRRHPDIRWLRREQDVEQLSQIQHTILDRLWPTLKPGGTLLLVTCSIFLEEGPLLSQSFLDSHPDSRLLPSPGSVLPVADPACQEAARRYITSPDGFYYARITKAEQA